MRCRSLFLGIIPSPSGLGFGKRLGAAAGSPDLRSPDSERPIVAGRVAQLRRLGLDLLAEWEGKIYILAPGQEASVLQAAGMAWAPETGRLPAARFVPTGAQNGLNGAYHSYKELEKDLYDLQTRYPDLAKVVDLGTSLEKRHIYALKISSAAARELSKPEVLFLGCHHAREWISVEVPFQLGNTWPKITLSIRKSAVLSMPRPSGSFPWSIRTDSSTRSSPIAIGARSPGQRQRLLRRRSQPQLWITPGASTMRAPAPARFRYLSRLGGFLRAGSPGRPRFLPLPQYRALITYHSFAQTIVYPWGYTSQPAKDDAAMSAIAAAWPLSSRRSTAGCTPAWTCT